MIRKEYPQLREVYWEEVLPNGLRIRIVPKPDFARKYAFFATNFGAIDTRFTVDGQRVTVPDGIAHYLEHKMFDMPQGDAMQEFARCGGNPNAFTSYDLTAYYFDCTENFEENLKILTQMVFMPYFTQASVDKERGIIAQEIRMYDDNADSRASERLFAALFQHHPVRVPIAGTVQSIQDITPQMLYQCHKTFYDPSNMMLCVVGDVVPQRVVELVAKLAPESVGQTVVRDYGAPEKLERPSQSVQMQMDISMPKFDIGFRCQPPGSDALQSELIGDLAAEILMGESSPLYGRLYKAGKIDDSFGAGYESTKGVAMLTVDGDSDVPQEVLAEILKEAERVGAEGFDLARFERLKKSAIGRRMRSLDSFEGICYQMCAHFFEGVDYFAFPHSYAGVTPQQVQAFLRQTVRADRMAISMIYPTQQEEASC